MMVPTATAPPDAALAGTPPALPPPVLGAPIPPAGPPPAGMTGADINPNVGIDGEIPGVEPPGGAPAANPAAPGSSNQVMAALNRVITNMTDQDVATEFTSYRTWVEESGSQALLDSLVQGSAPVFFLSLIDEQVVAVHSFARYLNEFGRPPRSLLHQRVFAIAGDLVMSQMGIWRGPSTVGNRVQDWFEGNVDVVIPTPEELTNSQGNLIQTPAATADRPATSVPRMIMVPRAWAPYFLEYRSRTETSTWITNRIAALPPDLQGSFATLRNWALSTHITTDLGGETPVMTCRWQPPPPDPVLVQFMWDRLNRLSPRYRGY
jgi:hypothetical protein